MRIASFARLCARSIVAASEGIAMPSGYADETAWLRSFKG
jgi:hypothetical protein